MLSEVLTTFFARIELAYAAQERFCVMLLASGRALRVVGCYRMNERPPGISKFFLRRGLPAGGRGSRHCVERLSLLRDNLKWLGEGVRELY